MSGGEWIGSEGKGLAIFHVSTLEWMGEERTAEERMGWDWIGVFFKPRENER